MTTVTVTVLQLLLATVRVMSVDVAVLTRVTMMVVGVVLKAVTTMAGDGMVTTAIVMVRLPGVDYEIL